MPVRHVPSRGLADLRTLAGRADRQTPTYKAFLRVSVLELERTRHEQEIAKVRHRLSAMVARCGEIEAEKIKILASSGMSLPRPETAAEASRPGGLSPPAAQRGFPFTY